MRCPDCGTAKVPFTTITGQERGDIMTRPDLLALIARAQAGDTEARNRVVEENVGLVGRVANRWRYHPECERDDLVQIGIIGFMQAIETYEAAKGSLSKHVTFAMRKAIHYETVGHGRKHYPFICVNLDKLASREPRDTSDARELVESIMARSRLPRADREAVKRFLEDPATPPCRARRRAVGKMRDFVQRRGVEM